MSEILHDSIGMILTLFSSLKGQLSLTIKRKKNIYSTKRTDLVMGQVWWGLSKCPFMNQKAVKKIQARWQTREFYRNSQHITGNKMVRGWAENLSE